MSQSLLVFLVAKPEEFADFEKRKTSACYGARETEREAGKRTSSLLNARPLRYVRSLHTKYAF